MHTAMEYGEARLAERYRHIAVERMADLPILNPRLMVEVVGFRDWRGHRLGVLITPWFMNLVILPEEAGSWSTLETGSARTWRFPAGEYRFAVSADDGVGFRYQTLALFSTVADFPDQDMARAVARSVIDGLLQERSAGEERSPGLAPAGRTVLDRPLSRRELLRRFLPGGHTDA